MEDFPVVMEYIPVQSAVVEYILELLVAKDHIALIEVQGHIIPVAVNKESKIQL